LVLIERKQLGFDQQGLDDAYATYDDPEESDLPISPDEIKDQLAEAKQYLLDMQMANGCIKRTLGHWRCRTHFGPPSCFTEALSQKRQGLPPSSLISEKTPLP